MFRLTLILDAPESMTQEQAEQAISDLEEKAAQLNLDLDSSELDEI